MTTTETSPVLACENVQKRYDSGVVALDGITLQVEAGELVALIGESGSGKTTLLRMFNRLVEPDSGSVSYRGQSIQGEDPIELRRSIGYVQQEGGLLPHWTVQRNVGLVPTLLGWPASQTDARTREILHLVGLPFETYGARYPRALSGGQRQRIAVARALAADPDVVLLDEPFGALDPITRTDLQREFDQLRRELNKTTLLVTHDLDEAFLLADRVGVLKDGKLEQLGTPAELRTAPASDYVKRLLSSMRGATLYVLLCLIAANAMTGVSFANDESNPGSTSTNSVNSIRADGGSRGTTGSTGKIVIASKNFEESRLLAEMFARLIEDQTQLAVERKFNLAGTQICFEALLSGDVDLYPEYTGTGLVSILKLPSNTDPAAVLNTVRQEFASRWQLTWLAPLGFENAYEIGIRKTLADELGIRSLSQLSEHASKMEAAFGAEFIGRPDGLPGLQELYGFEFGDVKTLQHHLKYEAAGQAEVDIIDVYTTDGQILKYGLSVLDDDLDFFPPYQAGPLVRSETLQQFPEIAAALNSLAGILDEDRMRSWNFLLQEGNATTEEVAQHALEELGLLKGSSIEVGSTRGRGFWSYIWNERNSLLQRTAEHLGMVFVSLLLAILVAVPLGLLLERRRSSAEWVVRGVGLFQTIPSIALLAFMIPVLGVGAKPAVAALFLYALFPIVRNTYSGVRDADPVAVQSATALGMTPGQILRQIRLPLAAPILMAGVRTAAVINVGTATLAAFIGAGGLGEPIVTGLQLSDKNIILSGAVPAALLALMVDAGLAAVERSLRPKGIES